MAYGSSGRSQKIDVAARSASYKAEQVRLKQEAADRREVAAARAKAAEDAATTAPTTDHD
jgi:hypothetical protein